MSRKIGLIILLILGCLFSPLNAAGQQSDEDLGVQLTLLPDDPTSLELRAADVKNTLRSLAIPYKVNLLVSERVSGKVTASFHEVPVREVFLAILRDAGLGYVQEGNILRIDTIEAIKESRKGAKSVTEPVTAHIQVKYAFDSENNTDLTDLAEEARKLLSKNKAANLSIIKRTNTLVVTDLPENVAKIKAMVKRLDKPSRQIAITSKIVSASSDFSHQLGIQWGGISTSSFRSHQVVTQGGTNTGGWASSSRSARPEADDTYNTSSMSGGHYAVNLPAASVAAGTGGALNVMIGKLGRNVLEMQLSAMESKSRGRILASPRVITQDNQTAKMETTVEVPYQVISTSATGNVISYNYKDATISLEVTPHVIENRIFMDVKVDKGDIIENTNSSIPPRIKTSTLTTKVLVNSGDTIVIGGLIERTQSKGEGGIPWLKDLPLIGWLFRYKTKSDDKEELLIFITPSILEIGRRSAGKGAIIGEPLLQERPPEEADKALGRRDDV